MKRAFLAATAILMSSFTPATFPALVAPAAATPSSADLIQYCEDNADTFGNGKILPNPGWYWVPVLGSIISSGGSGDFEISGYAFNPAKRTIHAIVVFDTTTTVYNLACNAYNPGDQLVGEFSYNTTYTEEDSTTSTTDRPAVCNPATTKGSGFPTSWYTVPGNSYLLGDLTCEALAAEYPGGPDLVAW